MRDEVVKKIIIFKILFPFSIDATAPSTRLGRLINHSMLTPNCKAKKSFFNGKLRLYFEATENITEGTEILYDYGER